VGIESAMERKGERGDLLLHTLNIEIYAILSGWKLSPYSETYATELQVLLEVAKMAELTTVLKVKKTALNNDNNFIRVLPQELPRLPIPNCFEGNSVIFKIEPYSKQIKNGRDPYVLSPYVDFASRQSCLSIYHMNHGGVAAFLPSDIESIKLC